jgi:hypothetical protein
MKVVTKDSETKLLEIVNGIKSNPGGYYALHFNLSQLSEQYKTEYQIKIAINILNDLFKAEDSIAFGLKDRDIILLYNGTNRGLLEKAIFQLRYLFMDDPLGYSVDGLENEDFCTVYDLEFGWRDFFSTCEKKSHFEPTLHSHALTSQISTIDGGVRTKLHVMNPETLVQITKNIQQTNISEAMRSQSACAIMIGREPKVIFEESYININHLSKIIKTDVDLLSQPTLFKYLTRTFDKRVLALLKIKAKMSDKFAISLNLNISTLFSDEFASFDSNLTPQQKASTIIELQIADVFEDIQMFTLAKETVQKLGYRICLDGLDSVCFTQIDRKNLGVDLAKVQWHPELDTESGKEKKEMLSNAVQRSDPKRVILCRCDNEKAVEYGKSIGIALFQGRHIDNMLNPKARIVN